MTVLIRHTRLFTEPVPYVVQLIENVDSFFRFEILYEVVQFGLPGVYLSGFVLLAAVIFGIGPEVKDKTIGVLNRLLKIGMVLGLVSLFTGRF